MNDFTKGLMFITVALLIVGVIGYIGILRSARFEVKRDKKLER